MTEAEMTEALLVLGIVIAWFVFNAWVSRRRCWGTLIFAD